MRVRRFSDARAFGDHVGPALMRQERENNVPLGIIRGLANTPSDAALMLAVEDSGQAICAAVMTPPFKLVLSSGPPAAAGLLAEHLRAERIAVPGVTANAELADAFATAWRKRHASRIAGVIEIKLYSLGTPPPKPPTLGTLRAAAVADTPLLRDWSAEFFADAGLPPEERDSFIASLDERIAASRLWLWDNGGPVCMLGHTETTPRTARIGPVFTPRSVRGKGYATAAVSELTRRLLAGGRTWCQLFADVANPTSTDMYRRIGYEEVCLFREYKFDP